MEDHINLFSKLMEARDFHALSLFSLSLNSLVSDWKLFHQALGDNAYTMKIGELIARVLRHITHARKASATD
jgi:hypothetical protein